VVVRRELMRGLPRLSATTTVLQRARLADPLGGMWEAADVPRSGHRPSWGGGPGARVRRRAAGGPGEAADGTVAGYALFWFDPVTRVGLVEPMRVEDGYQRRGLARTLLTNGLDRLARKGALRLKVGFDSDAAPDLYLDAGFVQTSVDRALIRAATATQRHVTPRG